MLVDIVSETERLVEFPYVWWNRGTPIAILIYSIQCDIHRSFLQSSASVVNDMFAAGPEP